MPIWDPHAARATALQALEARLAAGEGDVELQLARANLLAELGRGDAAREAYLQVLQQRPDHLGALTNLGALVHAQGFTSAARTLYAEAARLHPGDPIAQVNLANSLARDDEPAAAEAAFAAALAADPGFPAAHRGAALLASTRGDAAGARRHLVGHDARSRHRPEGTRRQPRVRHRALFRRARRLGAVRQRAEPRHPAGAQRGRHGPS